MTAAALVAGTPYGTSGTREGCAPYWPTTANGGGFLCLPSLQAGVSVNGGADCVVNGLAYRNQAGTPFGVCVDPGSVTDQDIVTGAANSFQVASGTAICAARGLDAKTANGFVVCSGSVADSVRDAEAVKKLDGVNSAVAQLQAAMNSAAKDARTDSATLNKTSADGLSAVDGSVKALGAGGGTGSDPQATPAPAATTGTATYQAPDFGTVADVTTPSVAGPVALALLAAVLMVIGVRAGLGFIKKVVR